MKAADFAIRHPAVIGILLIGLALFGLLSFRGMDRDLLANINFPEVLVLTVYPGASPEVVERDVTEILEKEFSLIQGIETISSNSREGYSTIVVAMGWNADVEAMKNDIRDRINNAMSEMPDGIQGSPGLFDMGTSAVPVYTALVESDLPNEELARMLEESIVPRFSRIRDVSAVYARGVEGPAVRVSLDPAKLGTMGLSALEAYAAIAGAQATVPAGDILTGQDRLALQSDADWTSLEQIGRHPVGYSPDGRPVYLDDVALIEMGLENPEFRAYSGGVRTVALDVMKRPGGDTVGIVDGIMDIQDTIIAETRGMVRFRTILNDAATISLTLRSVSYSAWFGGLLAILVLVLFLHDLRASLIVTLSIPFTVFLTFILMNARGMTLNMMTLAGITVSIGMVVDSSIVILENTMRHRRMNLKAARAASVGAAEVGGAILASTSTSLSVFLPVLWVSGLPGAVLKEVAWTLLFALSSSALTAIFIVPWLASRILDGERKLQGLKRFGDRFDSRFDRLAERYAVLLSTALNRKASVIIMSIFLIAASAGILGMLGAELFAPPDSNEFEITVRLPAGYALQQAESKMAEVAAVVHEEVPEMELDLWYAGLADSATIIDTGNPSSGYGRIRLVRTAQRDRSVFEIVAHLNQVLPARIPDAEFDVRNGGLAKLMNYATDGAGFRVEVSGAEWDDVLEASGIVAGILESDPLVISTDNGIRSDREIMVLNQDRISTARLAVDPGSAGMNLRILFNGEEAGQLKSGGVSMPIYVDSPLAGGRLPDGILGRIGIRGAGGTMIPYSAFSTFERRDSTDRIPHRDRLPSVVVVGNLRENDLSAIRSRVLPRLESAVLPEGISWRITGVVDLMGDTFRDLGLSLAIAVFLVYAVMVVQFERFAQPFVIMGAVPFVLIGVSLSLAAFGTRITMMTFFGVIALGGMVVNNAIVLLEFANQRRKEGSDPRSAILEAARIRLKPILITTLTTLLGLIPLAFSVGEGSEIYAPLGQVIGGGLITSTLITLFIVPVFYEIQENRRLRRMDSGNRRFSNPGISQTMVPHERTRPQ